MWASLSRRFVALLFILIYELVSFVSLSIYKHHGFRTLYLLLLIRHTKTLHCHLVPSRKKKSFVRKMIKGNAIIYFPHCNLLMWFLVYRQIDCYMFTKSTTYGEAISFRNTKSRLFVTACTIIYSRNLYTQDDYN